MSVLHSHCIHKAEDLEPEFPRAQCFSFAHQPTRWWQQLQQPLATGWRRLHHAALGEQLTGAHWPAKTYRLVKQNYDVELSSFPSGGTMVFLCRAANFQRS